MKCDSKTTQQGKRQRDRQRQPNAEERETDRRGDRTECKVMNTQSVLRSVVRGGVRVEEGGGGSSGGGSVGGGSVRGHQPTVVEVRVPGGRVGGEGCWGLRVVSQFSLLQWVLLRAHPSDSLAARLQG